MRQVYLDLSNSGFMAFLDVYLHNIFYFWVHGRLDYKHNKIDNNNNDIHVLIAESNFFKFGVRAIFRPL